jgi:hypothetical protein
MVSSRSSDACIGFVADSNNVACLELLVSFLIIFHTEFQVGLVKSLFQFLLFLIILIVAPILLYEDFRNTAATIAGRRRALSRKSTHKNPYYLSISSRIAGRVFKKRKDPYLKTQPPTDPGSNNSGNRLPNGAHAW